MLLKRVVSLTVKAPVPPGGDDTEIFKVVTNPIGFVNHYTGLMNSPNCVLELKGGPLGRVSGLLHLFYCTSGRGAGAPYLNRGVS